MARISSGDWADWAFFLLLVGEFAEDAFVNVHDGVLLIPFFLCPEIIVSR